MPKPSAARRATAPPMRPSPTMPSVLPCTSTPKRRPRRCSPFAAPCRCVQFRDPARGGEDQREDVSAVDSVSFVGRVASTMPRRVSPSTSKLSKPTEMVASASSRVAPSSIRERFSSRRSRRPHARARAERRRGGVGVRQRDVTPCFEHSHHAGGQLAIGNDMFLHRESLEQGAERRLSAHVMKRLRKRLLACHYKSPIESSSILLIILGLHDGR